jgi:hypothetical protein
MRLPPSLAVGAQSDFHFDWTLTEH